MRFQSSAAPKATAKTDAFVVFRAEKSKDLGTLPLPDKALVSAAADAVKAGEFSGKGNETVLIRGGRDGRRCLLVGAGADLLPESLRRAAGRAARVLDARGITHATLLVPGGGAADAVTQGAALAMYRFDQCRGDKRPKASFKRATVAPETGGVTLVRSAVKLGEALAASVAFARDLGNLPGNIATATYLARRARELAGGNLSVRIHDRAGLKKLKMGAFLAVAQGSRNEPRLIEFRYRGAPGKKKTIAIVGKGVTFDTGGISIKPPAKMEEMKFDMCGGGAVLGLMHAVAALKPKVNLHAFVPATDNMPDGNAYRPGDIVTARNGKTIEIISTDAEGRLLLCDTLAYAAEKKPSLLVDLATLTGACVVALGDAAAGVFGGAAAVEKVKAAAERSDETVWPLPLYPRYTEMMKSPYADLKNGGGRWGGACTAAAFLQEFVGDVEWAHVDIAGMAWTDGNSDYRHKGATGYGVRLLWELVNG